MSELTKAEKKWVRDVQKVLDKCPSKRIGFYTIGDNNVMLWDTDKKEEAMAQEDDFCVIVENCDAGFDEELIFPNPVESTAG